MGGTWNWAEEYCTWWFSIVTVGLRSAVFGEEAVSVC